MKRAIKVVQGCVRDGWSETSTLEGEVVFAEASPDGTRLRLRAGDSERQIWVSRGIQASSIHVGSRLRGFYGNARIGNDPVILAYELYDNKGKLLMRARQEGFAFVDAAYS
ncbi:MAG: hypothetical protein KKD18_00575 [Nanoarchaeota archaeon]|nr:hypothetical protein [Nanoarchaeota archaeon]